MKKVNSNGRYLKFPGITVVASICQKDEMFWQEVFQLLNRSELLLSHYSPLPYESYHLTTLNLCVESDFEPGEWPQYLRSAGPNVYQPMCAYLQEHSFVPNIHFEYIQTRGAIQLVFSLPKEQHAMILETGKRYGLVHQVPAAFHMTLAYQYRDVSPEDLQRIEAYLHQGLHELFKKRDSRFELNPPTLCYFLDMTAFYPWDASYLPF